MPAPYRDKHFLEMSDREREARRLAEIQRPGRDAIEGVYPEEFLVPAARGAIKAVEKLAAQRAPKNAPKVEMPGELKPNVPGRPYYMRGNLLDEKYNPKDFTPAKMEQIKKDLARKAKMSPQEQRLERMREYDLKLDVSAAKKALADKSLLSAGASAFQDEQEYKRGGAVKSKAFRGDGVAQRGKTKGRFV